MTAGKGRSLRELVELVQEHFPEVEVEYVERDKLRPFRGTLSMEKAKRLMDFAAAGRARGGPRPLRELVPRAHVGPTLVRSSVAACARTPGSPSGSGGPS